MTSTDDDGSLRDLDSVLREHGVEPALAERIRALVASSERAPGSHSRARVSIPATRVSLPSSLHSAPTLGPQDFQLDPGSTQPARPLAKELAVPAAAPTTRQTDPAPAPVSDGPLLVPLMLIGEGGMGEVHRAHDRPLGRDLAMKVLHSHLSPVPRMRSRFFDEAQITAQLSHPSIPPVHALGQLEDGRPYFTMKEVHGRTLAELLELGFGPEGLSEQRRIEIFHRVCEAVAYAHARGVIHCDLKPLNVMVGTFGEVLVMDWGVARLVDPAGQTRVAEPAVRTTISGAQTGWDIAGTPAYMPPEQALGETHRLGPPADVYALGVMLYELLAGERPYQGTVPAMLLQAAQGEIPPLPRRPRSIVDDSLFDIVLTAMRPEPGDRYADAGALAADVARWRDGAIRREKAIAKVHDATARLAEVTPMRGHAEALRREAAELLASMAPAPGIDDKRTAWAKEDEALAIERDAARRTAEIRQLLEAALVHAPELAEPKAMLADLAFEEHRDAERRRAWDEAALHEVRLRAYDIGLYSDYLEGNAQLALATDAPCDVRLSRYELRDRALTAIPAGELGTTPIDVELRAGSYLLELVRDGVRPIAYPVLLRRRSDWRGELPDASAPTTLELPAPGELGPGEIFVAAGPFEQGGDPHAPGGLPAQQVWVDAFVIQENPVTFRELARFLVDPAGAPFRQAVLRDGLGLFRPEWPAVGLCWDGAREYARWLSARTGQSWRLPYELEWEKAARGADGRFFPWGDLAEGAFSHLRTQDRAPLTPIGVDQVTTDRSPYGVRGMAGNVRDWCADAFVLATTSETRTGSGLLARRVVRGGSFRSSIDDARAAARGGLPASKGFRDVGFRLVRSLARR